MTIDISKIKPGDKVTLVPLEVAAVNNLRNEIAAYVGDRYRFFPAEQIAAHHPAPREFKVGDRVLEGRNGWDVLTIVAMDGDEAWVKTTSGRNFTARTSDLTLAEAGE